MTEEALSAPAIEASPPVDIFELTRRKVAAETAARLSIISGVSITTIATICRGRCPSYLKWKQLAGVLEADTPEWTERWQRSYRDRLQETLKATRLVATIETLFSQYLPNPERTWTREKRIPASLQDMNPLHLRKTLWALRKGHLLDWKTTDRVIVAVGASLSERVDTAFAWLHQKLQPQQSAYRPRKKKKNSHTSPSINTAFPGVHQSPPEEAAGTLLSTAEDDTTSANSPEISDPCADFYECLGDERALLLLFLQEESNAFWEEFGTSLPFQPGSDKEITFKNLYLRAQALVFWRESKRGQTAEEEGLSVDETVLLSDPRELSTSSLLKRARKRLRGGDFSGCLGDINHIVCKRTDVSPQLMQCANSLFRTLTILEQLLPKKPPVIFGEAAAEELQDPDPAPAPVQPPTSDLPPIETESPANIEAPVVETIAAPDQSSLTAPSDTESADDKPAPAPQQDSAASVQEAAPVPAEATGTPTNAADAMTATPPEPAPSPAPKPKNLDRLRLIRKRHKKLQKMKYVRANNTVPEPSSAATPITPVEDDNENPSLEGTDSLPDSTIPENNPPEVSSTYTRPLWERRLRRLQCDCRDVKADEKEILPRFLQSLEKDAPADIARRVVHHKVLALSTRTVLLTTLLREKTITDDDIRAAEAAPATSQSKLDFWNT